MNIPLYFINMFSSSEEEYLCFGLRIKHESPGWYKSLIDILKKIKGAAYTIDVEVGMALVSGRANSKSILKKLGKWGLEVAWIKTGKPNTYGGHGYYEINPYLLYHPNQHYSINYCDPYAPYPPPLEPYTCFSTRYY